MKLLVQNCKFKKAVRRKKKQRERNCKFKKVRKEKEKTKRERKKKSD